MSIFPIHKGAVRQRFFGLRTRFSPRGILRVASSIQFGPGRVREARESTLRLGELVILFHHGR